MKQGGFTLVELLVGTALAGMAVMTASGIYMATAESLVRMNARAESWDRRMQARAWLSQALSGASAAPGAAFDGTESSIAFNTWMWVAEGWLERRSVEISADSGQLRLAVGGHPPVDLLDSLEGVRIEYFDVSAEGATWLPRWHSFASPPRAVRFEMVGSDGSLDVVLIRLEERG